MPHKARRQKRVLAGLMASPGMAGTEKTIVEIFDDKLKK